MKVVIHDACALIDLLKAGLVEAWTGAGIEIHTTELALLEVMDDASALYESGALKVVGLSSDELFSLVEFKQSYKALSLEDCSVLRLASNLQVPLLTGDRDLRTIAERVGVKVHGMLWVLDQLVEGRSITTIQAIKALHTLRQNGSRFPKDEVEMRINAWSPS
jgi:predicted nucleic acid-binding protein